MRLRRKQSFDFDLFGLPDHTAADAFSRMWRTCESVRNEEPDDELEQIAERFNLKGREAVCDFLRQHRSLIPILVEVRQRFDEYFGVVENHRPHLEVFVDVEEDSKPKLFALALVAPLAEASTQLDRLDQEWWLEQPYEIRRLMNIDVEYVDGSV